MTEATEGSETSEETEAQNGGQLESDSNIRESKAEYNARASENEEYVEPKSFYKEVKAKNGTKKSPQKKGGLELLVSDSENNSGSLKPNIVNVIKEYESDSAESEDESEGEDTANGALVIVYHRNEKTGEIEVLFEQKTFDYPTKSERGKIAPIGGAMKTTDRNSLEALIREVREEIGEPTASIITWALLRNGYKYYTAIDVYDGVIGATDIWAVEITSRKDWEAMKYSYYMHDVMIQRGKDIVNLNDDYFAFGYGKIIKGFVLDNPSNTRSTGLINFPNNTILSHMYLDGNKVANPTKPASEAIIFSGTAAKPFTYLLNAA